MGSYISVDYGKKSKLAISIYPSHHLSYSMTEPYNTVLAAHNSLDHTDIDIIMDNNAIYDICKRKLEI